MRLKRCSCLLLAALLVLSSCGFSPFRTAFAADPYLPELPSWVIPLGAAPRVRSYANDTSYPLWEYSDGSGPSSAFEDALLPVGTYMVECDLDSSNLFYLGSQSYVFSGVFAYFRSDALPFPYLVTLEIENFDANVSWTSEIECSFRQFGSLLYFSVEYDGDAPSGTRIRGVNLYFSKPSDSSMFVPADSDYTGIPVACSLYYSGLRVESVPTPSQDDQFQSGVIGGLDDIEDSIDKGFDSIQGEISSGSDEVVDAVDGVKDSVDSVGDDIVQWGQNIVTGITEGVTNIQETIVEQTETLGNFILDGLKSLFIPSEGYFKELFDDLNEFFSDVFGFLYFPIEHVISWFNRLLTLPENEPSIAIPELAYEDTVLIEAQTYTFDFLDDEPFSTVHDYYLLAMDAAMIMGFVHLLQRKYEEVMKN